MHAPELGAAMQVREYFSRIEQLVRIEGAFQPDLLIEIELGKHLRHEVPLLDADAMLAGEHAADFHAEPQNVGTEMLGPFELTRLVGIVEHQRVQVAVSGMKDIGDA